MIISNPVVRFALRIFGLADGQRDPFAVRGNRPGQAHSPFVLVTRAPDGRWGVFQHDYDRPLATFERIEEACEYADDRARTQPDAMVLIGKGWARPPTRARP